MQILVKSYKKYVTSLIERNKNNIDNTLQIKIPSYVFDYQQTLAFLSSLKKDYCFTESINLNLKIANELVDMWGLDSENRDYIKKNNWDLSNGSFTYYRNNLAIKNDNTQEVLILIGADLVYDSGSLEHLLNCDFDNLFHHSLNNNFDEWVDILLMEFDNNIDLSYDIQKVLFTIYKQYDLKTLSEYLDILIKNKDNYYLDDSICHIILKNLYLISSYSCNIKVDNNFTSNFNRNIKFGESLFFGEIAQEKATKDRYLKKIDSFIQHESDEEDTEYSNLEENLSIYCPSYNDTLSFLLALKKLVNNECSNDIKDKLRECDLNYIKNKIFQLKIKKPVKETPSNKEIFVEGTPFEMLLSALWDMLSYVIFEKNLPKEEIINISITGESLTHNISTNEIHFNSNSVDDSSYVFDKVFKPVLGGLDLYFINNIESMFYDWHEEDLNFLSCNISSPSSYRTFKYSSIAIPLVKFKIKINNYSKKYKWQLKANNDISLSYDIAHKINNEIIENQLNSNDIIPSFALKNYNSCFFMQNEEDFKDEVVSSLKASSKNFVLNLFEEELKDELSQEDIYQIEELSRKFKNYIKEFVEDGLYSAINSLNCDELINCYNTMLYSINHSNDFIDVLAELFLKAFWIVNKDELDQTNNVSNGILTILHPAMLEEVKSKNTYIKSFFEELVINDLDSNSKIKYNKSTQKWDYCKELSLLKSPIPGFYNQNGNQVCTDIKGSGLIYRIGSMDIKKIDAILTTKFSHTQEESITESKLEKETQESKLITKQLLNFVSIHEYAQDGINISVIIDNPIQPLIAGIINFVEAVFNDIEDFSIYEENPYQIQLNVISTENNEFAIYSWLESLSEYWKNKELNDTKKARPFKFSNLNISYSIIKKNENINEFSKVLSSKLDSDLTILYSNSDSCSVLFRDLIVDESDEILLAFPMLQKVLPKFKMNSKRNERYKVYLNRQFKSSTEYIKLMNTVRIGKPLIDKKNEIYLLKKLIYSNFIEVLEICHNNSEMVLCIGEDVDKDIVLSNSYNSTILIGFGSGIGSRAELNYTLSTKIDNRNIIVDNLSNSLMQLYVQFNETSSLKIVENLLSQTKKVTDLSIFRALSNSDTNKHDYFAYMFTRRILNLKKDKDIVCDTIVSLDSYMHWFKFENSKEHTDLIWLVVRKERDENSRDIYKVNMHLIECKLGKNVTKTYSDKAYEQLICTEKVLASHFNNKKNLISDSKYWWMQLYRIIAANMNITKSIECPKELQRLSEGDYKIEMDKSMFMFERLSSNNKTIKKLKLDKNQAGGIIPIYEFSPEYINSISLMQEENLPIFDIYQIDNSAKIVKEIALEDDVIDFYEDQKIKQNTVEYTISNQLSKDKDISDIPVDIFKNGYLKSDFLNKAAEKKEQYVDILEKDFNSRDLRIWIGTDVNGNKRYWDFGQNYKLNNRHLFCFGSTGSGKTYALQGIISELAKYQQGSLIFDYNNGMRPADIPKNIKKFIKPQVLLQNTKLNINPFLKHGSYFDEDDPNSYLEDDSYQVASRIADIISTQFYSIGENQKPALTELIEQGIDTYGDSYSLTQMGFDLDKAEDKKYEKLKEKLMPLIKSDPFSGEAKLMNWEDQFKGNRKNQFVNVFQLTHLAKAIQLLIVEFCLNDLWYYANNNNFNTDHPKVIMLDEIQNLDLRNESTVNKYLVEGRKFGLNLILATQSISKIGGKKSGIYSGLTSAGVQLYFKPSDNEIDDVAKQLVNKDPNPNHRIQYWTGKLAELNRGECYFISNTDNKNGPIKIKIPSMEERGF